MTTSGSGVSLSSSRWCDGVLRFSRVAGKMLRRTCVLVELGLVEVLDERLDGLNVAIPLDLSASLHHLQALTACESTHIL